MDLKLRGRVVRIVGASGGIGAATARTLYAEGAKLALVARRVEALNTLVREFDGEPGRVLVLPCDAATRGAIDEAVARTVAQLGALQHLVVVAAPMGPRQALDELNDDDWEAYFETSLMLAVRSCRAALPELLKDAGSSLVLTSAYSIRSQKPGLVAYTAMKSAVASVAKNIARTYGPRGLRANCIAPGVIERDAAHSRLLALQYGVPQEQARYEQVRRESGMSVALARAGRHEEFADLIAYLLSARASYVNGATVNIDGGTDF